MTVLQRHINCHYFYDRTLAKGVTKKTKEVNLTIIQPCTEAFSFEVGQKPVKWPA